MRAMVFERPGQPLREQQVADPTPSSEQLLIRVEACGICRTDLHIVDGELDEPKLPLIPGHQIVGRVVECGANATEFSIGQRVGVPWLGCVCGRCRFCQGGRENLCDRARFTGYHLDGGFAELCVADARFAFPVGEGDAATIAPLLCAGLIGYRSLKIALQSAGDARTVGLYGFGAAAHLVLQVARYQGRSVFAFTRPGDSDGREFALRLGATWAGGSDQAPPEPLHAAIVFAPVGALVPAALRAVEKGGAVVCGGIHMSDIPTFPYELLWGERMIRSVANLTRDDARELLALAPKIPLRTEATCFPLASANRALSDLRSGKIHGAGVLVV